MGTPLLIPAVAILVSDLYEAEAELINAGFETDWMNGYLLVYSENADTWLPVNENDTVVYFDGPLEDERAPRVIHVRKWMPQKWIAF